MPVDDNLANRVRRCVTKHAGLSERKMFGCVGFFLNGNVACGVHEDELIVRLSPDSTDSALREPHTRRFDLSGRPMKGWLLVKVKDDETLSRWIKRGTTYAATLPRR
jgi:hypothetical protein